MPPGVIPGWHTDKKKNILSLLHLYYIKLFLKHPLTMKKLFYLLLLPLLAVMVTACDDDDKDLPNVTLSIEYSGATEQDGVLTVEQGQILNIDALVVTPAEGTKQATLGQTIYYIDGIPFYSTVVVPFATEINTTGMEIGMHTLGVRSTVYQVDKEIGFALAEFKFQVIEPTGSDAPEDGSGTITPEVRVTDGD